MRFWQFFKASKQAADFHFYEVVFEGDTVFGVTATSSEEAEALVCTQIYHDQTIPGMPNTRELNLKQVQLTYKHLTKRQIMKKGIWHPHFT